MKKRTIRQRLYKFKQYLIDKKFTVNTINMHMTRIKSIYKFYDLETPRIREIPNTTHETIEDIPTKQHIRKAIQNTNNIQLQALILFMSSSGTSVNEATKITIQDFINATKEYHNETKIQDVINVLKNKQYIVPTFQMYRQKTHYPYITFCTPEATEKIIQHLQQRSRYHELKPNTPIFQIHPNSVAVNFKRLSHKCGWTDKNGVHFFIPMQCGNSLQQN